MVHGRGAAHKVEASAEFQLHDSLPCTLTIQWLEHNIIGDSWTAQTY